MKRFGWMAAVALAALGFGMFAGPGATTLAAKKEDKMLLHNVFFTLKDSTDANRAKLIEACKKYLVKHEGVVYFAAGARGTEFAREVNDKDFDVGLHIVFKDKASHDKYADAPDHLKFIEEEKATWKTVKVFDDYIETVDPKG
ncbi:MAG TPA: Dabb family protein [Planctomycetia bacterium]|nr:Dabb family protein [Planctomycetia bacterium]